MRGVPSGWRNASQTQIGDTICPDNCLEPLAGSARKSQQKRMRRPVVDGSQGARKFLIPRSRVVDRLLAQMLSGRLDRELAAGRPAEWSRLNSARADQLVSLPFRTQLADDWDHVLDVATGRAAMSRNARAVLRRDRVAEAAPRIRELTTALRSPQPVPARGVAAAYLLLTDGTGSVYNGVSTTVLSDAVAGAIALLDPVSRS